MFSYRSSTMNRMHTSITIAFSMVTVFAKSDLNKGYYWRGYGQEIPKDAFIAITKKSGNNVYVAKKIHIPDVFEKPVNPCIEGDWGNSQWLIHNYTQTEYPHPPSKCHDYVLLIVLGQICEGRNKIEYEWRYAGQEDDKDFQILCTHQPKDFEWLKTNSTDIVNLVGSRYLVPGGVENNHDTYVGRATDSNNVELVGKVVSYGEDRMLFFGTTGGNHVVCRVSEFDVLAYNPK